MLLVVSSAAATPANVTNTVPNIISRLTNAGEKVVEASNVVDSGGMSWIVLMRGLPNGSLTYSLVKTIGGGADGVTDSPRLPMELAKHLDASLVPATQTSIMAAQLEWFRTHKALQAYIDSNTASFANPPDIAVKTYWSQGLSLPGYPFKKPKDGTNDGPQS